MDNAILNSRLFAGLTEAEIQKLLICCKAKQKHVPRGGMIYDVGDKASDILLVLRGILLVSGYDYWGNRTIHAEAAEGDIFGAAYATAPALPVAVETQSGCDILLLPYEKLTEPCENTCTFHQRVLKNIIDILARKNMSQMEKMGHLTKRTMREKILSYLSAAAAKTTEKIFAIPFDRRQLADYLAVDRSALCRELSKLKREGVLDYNKNKFRLGVGI